MRVFEKVNGEIRSEGTFGSSGVSLRRTDLDTDKSVGDVRTSTSGRSSDVPEDT